MVHRDEEEEARIRRQNLNGTGTTEYGRNETWRAKYNGWSGKGKEKGNERDRIGGLESSVRGGREEVRRAL